MIFFPQVCNDEKGVQLRKQQTEQFEFEQKRRKKEKKQG